MTIIRVMNGDVPLIKKIEVSSSELFEKIYKSAMLLYPDSTLFFGEYREKKIKIFGFSHFDVQECKHAQSTYRTRNLLGKREEKTDPDDFFLSEAEKKACQHFIERNMGNH